MQLKEILSWNKEREKALGGRRYISETPHTQREKPIIDAPAVLLDACCDGISDSPEIVNQRSRS